MLSYYLDDRLTIKKIEQELENLKIIKQQEFEKLEQVLEKYKINNYWKNSNLF